jgi:hypothetical protein
MSILDNTLNFGLKLIDYATRGWHREEYSNLKMIDGLLANIVDDGIPFIADSSVAPNTITLTYSPAIAAYVSGLALSFKLANSVSGATTIAVNGLTAKTLKKRGSAIQAGDLVVGDYVRVIYDGTDFVLIQPINAEELILEDASITPTKLTSGHPNWDSSGNTDVDGTFAADGKISALTDKNVFHHSDSALNSASITLSTADPSGGSAGDIWLKYTA